MLDGHSGMQDDERCGGACRAIDVVDLLPAKHPADCSADNNDLSSVNRNWGEPDEPHPSKPLNEGSRPPFNPKESCRIGCMNVNTMYRTGRTVLMVEEMQRYNIEVLGISESRWLGSGVTSVQGIRIIHFGKKEGSHERGVAIALGRRTQKMLETYQCVSERIVTCRLKGKYGNIKVIQVYAPTEDKSEEEKDDFYEQLEEVVSHSRRHDLLLVMGDFNAKIGEDEGL